MSKTHKHIKKSFCVSKTKECRGKKGVCPFLLLENSRPLSSLRESQTPPLLWDPRFLINLPTNWFLEKEAEYIKEEKAYQHNELSWSLSFSTHTYPFPLKERFQTIVGSRKFKKHSRNDGTKTQWVDKGFWKEAVITQAGQLPIVL